MNISAEALFRALSDSTRLRCLALLAREGELCVCELTHALDVPQPRVSRHLAQLRDCGLARDRRHGQWVFYRLETNWPEWVTTVVTTALEEISRDAPFAADLGRLKAMTDRPDRLVCA